jgi:hypothetical protein
MKTLPKSVKNEILEISFTQKKTYQLKKNNNKTNFYLFIFIAVSAAIAAVLTKFEIINLF